MEESGLKESDDLEIIEATLELKAEAINKSN